MTPRTYKNKKGSTIVAVIVLVAALMLMGTMYLSGSFYTYKFTKDLSEVDSALIAAELATKRWFYIIEDMMSNNKYYGLQYSPAKGQEKEYVRKILRDITGVGEKGILGTGGSENDVVGDTNFTNYYTIKIKGEEGRQYDVEFKLFDIDDVERDTGTISASVGIHSVTKAYYADSAAVITDNKSLYFEKTIEFPYFEPVKLTSAILAVGDITTVGDGLAKIYGDAYSFGTGPKQTIHPKQYFYGGIVAANSSQLNIYGNAFTRSFVRTGKYKQNEPSIIRVTKDIFAQGVQTFSTNSQIYAYRNVYTLDDVENNAEGSVIGVNGSFIGLSFAADATNHDQSSCILNSAAMHAQLSNKASRARIVVNGDVIVGGTAFKINPQTGVGDFAIESGGLIYPEENPAQEYSNNLPTYKYESKFKQNDVDVSRQYLNFLKSTTDVKKTSYVNIVQARTPLSLDPFNPDTPSINTWITNINSARSGGDNEYLNKWTAGSFTRNTNISGILDYADQSIFGANDAIFWENSAVDAGNGQFDIQRPRYLNQDTYQVDGFLPSELEAVFKGSGTGMDLTKGKDEKNIIDLMSTADKVGLRNRVERFWKHYWKDFDVTNYNTYTQKFVDDQVIQIDPTSNDTKYLTVMKSNRDSSNNVLPENDPSRLARLSKLVETKLNYLLRRSYPASGSDWQYVLKEQGQAENKFVEVITKIEKLRPRLPLSAQKYVRILEDTTNSGTINKPISELLPTTGYVNTEPYLILIKDANIDLEVNQTFRGIIVTKGRIVMKPNGKILGMVMAAGRKHNEASASTVDALSKLNILDADANSNDHQKITDGTTAAILFETVSGAANPPEIDAFLGKMNDTNVVDGESLSDQFRSIYGMWRAREELIKQFEDVGVGLYQIF